MFEHLTPQARQAVVEAQRRARAAGRPAIASEHLLLALAAGDHAAGRALRAVGLDAAALADEAAADDADALRSLGVDLEQVRRRAEELFGPGALDDPPPAPRRRLGLRRGGAGGHLPVGPGLRDALGQAVAQAQAERSGSLGVEHLLLGLLAGGPGQDSAAVRALRRHGVEPDAVRRSLSEERGGAGAA